MNEISRFTYALGLMKSSLGSVLDNTGAQATLEYESGITKNDLLELDEKIHQMIQLFYLATKREQVS